jgi:hypothetical protein
LICCLNGDIGGSLEGLETAIEEDQFATIREAVVYVLTNLTPFKNYYVTDMPELIPHDLEFGATDTVWSILTTLRDLYPGYEMYFDADGTFICKQYITPNTEPAVLSNDYLQNLFMSETNNGVLKDIRNVSKVWGKCLDTDYRTDNCTYDDASNTYSAHFIGIALNTDDNSLPTSTKFAVKIPVVDTKDNAKLKIYNKPTAEGEEILVGTFDITNSLEEKIKKNSFLAETSYVFRYRRKSMYLLGQYQIFAVNKLRNTWPTDEEKRIDEEKHGTTNIE